MSAFLYKYHLNDMAIIVKKGDVNIQNFVEKGAKLKNVYYGSVNFGSGMDTIKGDLKKLNVTDEQVKNALERIKPQISTSRLWYAVYRPLVMIEKVKEGMFDEFKKYVESLITDLPKDIDIRDLQSKMDVQSFKQNIDKWDPENAPVKGKTFMSYYNVAKDFLAFIHDEIELDDDNEEDEEEEDEE